MSKNKAGWLWAMVFGFFFVMSVDLWAWDGDFLVLGFPYMIVYPFFLCLCLSAVLYIFGRSHWGRGGI